MKKKLLLFTFGTIAKLTYVPFCCSGQVMTNNNVAITITGGAQLTVKGDIQNNSGTAINNSGTIDLNGNWTNNSGGDVFGTSAGMVVMNGANQNIGGNNSTMFNNLTIQGTGTKTLQLNTSVGGGYAIPAGTLAMEASVLDLNSNTLFITNPNGNGITSVTGSIKSEQVNNSSKVDWNMQNVQGGHIVPFSNNAGTPVPFKYEITDNSNHGHVVMSTYATNASNIPYPVSPNMVTDVNTLGDGNPSNMVHRFWEVDVQNAPVLSSLTFTFDPTTEAPAGPGTLLAQNWNNVNTWNAPSLFQTALGADSIQLYNNDKYGTFALAKNFSVLPVTLITFFADLNAAGDVDIVWVTAAEVNNDFFTIERSADGINFETVAIVQGAGNSTVMLHYATIDKDPYQGISYYRLKQTDYDGISSYSQTVIINNSFTSTSNIMVYPNPVTDYVLISVQASVKNSGNIDFKLYDISGREVIASKLSQLSSIAENTFRFERGNLVPGAYFFRLVNNGEKMSEGKLVIQ